MFDVTWRTLIEGRERELVKQIGALSTQVAGLQRDIDNREQELAKVRLAIAGLAPETGGQVRNPAGDSTEVVTAASSARPNSNTTSIATPTLVHDRPKPEAALKEVKGARSDRDNSGQQDKVRTNRRWTAIWINPFALVP
jgi:hypothetical protein